jgi:hypothetical protein
MFFFTVIGIPAAFKIFKKEEAGKYTGSVFPKYFGSGYILGLVTLVSFYLLTKDAMNIFSWLNLTFLLLMNIFNFINGLIITPKAGFLKVGFYQTGDKSYYDKFLKLHRVSMVLNGLTFTLGLFSIGLTSLYLTF